MADKQIEQREYIVHLLKQYHDDRVPFATGVYVMICDAIVIYQEQCAGTCVDCLRTFDELQLYKMILSAIKMRTQSYEVGGELTRSIPDRIAHSRNTCDDTISIDKVFGSYLRDIVVSSTYPSIQLTEDTRGFIIVDVSHKDRKLVNTIDGHNLLNISVILDQLELNCGDAVTYTELSLTHKGNLKIRFAQTE